MSRSRRTIDASKAATFAAISLVIGRRTYWVDKLPRSVLPTLREHCNSPRRMLLAIQQAETIRRLRVSWRQRLGTRQSPKFGPRIDTNAVLALYFADSGKRLDGVSRGQAA